MTPGRMPRTASRLGVVLGGLLTIGVAAAAWAGPVAVPITVDYLLLDAGLRQRVYTGPGGRAEFWRGAEDCGHLYAMDPHFSDRDPRLRLESAADLQAALDVGGQCLNLLSWTGKLAAEASPRVEGWSLKFHVTDVEFLNADGAAIGGSAFNAAKGPLLGQLESFSYSLEPEVQRLRAVAGSSDAEVARVVRPVLDSAALGSNVAIAPEGLKLSLAVNVPANLETPRVLTVGQRTAFAAAAEKLRDFLRSVAAEVQPLIIDPGVSQQLEEILGQIRAKLGAAAAAPPANGDPLPLVREQWTKLREVATTAAHQGVFGAQTVEVLETLMVTDALFELDRQAPALGSHLAAAGLNSLSGQARTSARGAAPPS